MLPSTLLLSAGPIHQYSYWLLYAYFGGSSAVLGSSGVAAMNWVHTVVVGVFTVDMVLKTWYTAIHPNRYLKYVADSNKNNEDADVVV